MSRECGRAARGAKVEDTKRGRKFQRLNVIAAEISTQDGVSVLAPACYTGATTAILFETWFELFLLPELEVGSVIIMDNASFHRKKALSGIAEQRGFSLLFLPPYSPDFNRIQRLWANMKRGDYDRAIADYTQALRLNPNDAEACYNRGCAYDGKGDLDRAIADYTQALRLNPTLADAYKDRGIVYYMKGDYSHARADWEKTLQLDPSDAQARNNLETLRQMGY